MTELTKEISELRKKIKAELKKLYPNIKFSVTSSDGIQVKFSSTEVSGVVVEKILQKFTVKKTFDPIYTEFRIEALNDKRPY